MANKKINVAELDFDAIKQNIKTFLKGQETFQDYDFEGSGMSVLMDVLAYNTHYNALYNNMTINEMFLDSASKRNSVVSLSKMLGYVPRSAICSKATVSLTLTTTTAGPSVLTLPAYSTFSTSVNGVSYNFYNTSPYTITGAGTQYTFPDIKIIEGTPLTFNWTVAAGSIYVIPNSTVDLTTLKVQVQESSSTSIFETYTNGNDITIANSTTRVYFVKEIDDGLYQITFGDGIIGKQLDNGNVVHIEYMASNLSAPNGARLFNYTGSTLITNASTNISTLVPATGGAAAEDIESIRFNAPRTYAAQNRAVTPEDYKAVIYSALPNAKSVSVWGGEDNNPPVYGKIFVCVKPVDATKLTTAEKSNLISTILNSKNVVSVQPEIVDADSINIALTVTAYYNDRETTRSAAELKTIITNTIFDYDTNELERFESIFKYSKLSRLIDTCEASIVSNITTVALRRKMTPRYNVSAQYLINLINPIFYSDVPGGSISTTGFYIYGSDELHYLDDDGGNLRLIKYGSTANKIVVTPQIGFINHQGGVLDIRNLHITALADVDFEISIKPASNDVVSALTSIAQIARDHLTVNVIADKTANGDLRAGYNYTFSNSSA
jgi:hypothetical protein